VLSAVRRVPSRPWGSGAGDSNRDNLQGASMRRLFHGIAITALAIMILAFLDTSISGLLESDTLFRAIPGSRIPVSGLLDKDVEGAQTTSGFVAERYDPNTLLLVDPPSHAFAMKFMEVKGRIWRGVISIPETQEPGEFRFRVHGRHDQPGAEAETYSLRIFADKASYRADFRSPFMRYTGLRSWIVALGMLVVGVAMLGVSFILSGRAETRRQALGIGSIYKLAKHDGHWEVVFGLGSKHGVREGDRLLLLNASRSPVADLVAQKVRADFSLAHVGLDTRLTPNFLIARKAQPTQE
jgi:hypothetical protein